MKLSQWVAAAAGVSWVAVTALSPAPAQRSAASGPVARAGSYRPPTWPAFIQLPRDMRDPARLARFIAAFAAQRPGASLAIALAGPPAAADVAKRLPSGRATGTGKITLASGAVVTLIAVRPKESSDAVYHRAFAEATVTRGQLTAVLRDLPRTASVTLEPPNRPRLTVTGDIPRAIRLVRRSPPGTAVTARWPKRLVRYPRLSDGPVRENSALPPRTARRGRDFAPY